MIYDTTFEHETFNESTDQERVNLLKYWEPRIDTKPLKLTQESPRNVVLVVAESRDLGTSDSH